MNEVLDWVTDFVRDYIYALLFFGALFAVGLALHAWDWIWERITGRKPD